MSSNTLQAVLPALVILGVLGSGGYIAWRHRQRRREAWGAFAQARGWGFSESWGTLEVQGLYQGQQFSLLTEERGSGKGRHTVAVVRLDLGHALPPDLSLEPEGLGDKLLRAVGVKDEELGDEALDKAFDLKHLSPEARAVLRAPRVAQPLLAMVRHYSRFSIEAGLLEAEWRQVPDTLSALESLVGPALALADALGTVAANPEEQMRG